MEKFQSVLLAVWQEACRHIEITEMARNIAPLLVHDIPIDQILIRRIDPGEGCLHTVARGFPEAQHCQLESHSNCPDRLQQELRTWCAGGTVAHSSTDSAHKSLLQAIVPADHTRDILAGPLDGSDGLSGILVLISRPDQAFSVRHRCLAQALLEPFSAAMGNDCRLHEMAILREAAEADKRSLLIRLGRTEIADNIVGSESGLHMVMERVTQVSRLNVPVLILGETGSGKELIARAIHTRSPRSGGAFIRVNCGAIPAELIDSQLFGHERGAFTGANETRKGWFERADGGTLFLDEIGELPVAAQVRLLRILQDGWLERVGGQRQIRVDARIVAATHRDLAAEVTVGKFREDLWYRISTFPIRLPALRERPDDIPGLARHFAERAATRFGLYCIMPTQEQLGLLSAYHWPGNVRELAAVIDRAAILGNGTSLEIEKALGTAAPAAAAPQQPAQQVCGVQAAAADIEPLEHAIKTHIEAALRATRGRVEGPFGAAAVLKVNPSTLRAKMRRLQIDWRKFS